MGVRVRGYIEGGVVVEHNYFNSHNFSTVDPMSKCYDFLKA